jgi:hypothetical protein
MNFKPAIDKLVQLSPISNLGSIPSIVDTVKNVVGNVTSSDADQKAKIQAVIDADRAEQQKMMAAQTRPQGRRMRQASADESGYKGYKKGGKVSSASKRADGCAIRGKTRA